MKKLLFAMIFVCLLPVLSVAEEVEEGKIRLYPYAPPIPQSEIDRKKREQEHREKYEDFDRRLRNVNRKVEYERLLPKGETKMPKVTYTLPKQDVVHERKKSKEHRKLCKQLLKIFREMEEYYKDREDRQWVLSRKAMSIYYYMNPNYASDREVIEYAMPYLEWHIWEMPLRITNWDSPLQYIWILSENAQKYPDYYKDFLKNRKKYLVRYLEILEQCRPKLDEIPELEEKIRTFTGNMNVPEERQEKSRLTGRLTQLNCMKEDLHQRSILFGTVVVLLYEQTSYCEKDMKEVQDLMIQYHIEEEYQNRLFKKVEEAKAKKKTRN